MSAVSFSLFELWGTQPETYHSPTTLMDKVRITNERGGNGVRGAAASGLKRPRCDQRAERVCLGAPHGAKRHEQRDDEKDGPAPHPVGQGHPPDVGAAEEEDMDLGQVGPCQLCPVVPRPLHRWKNSAWELPNLNPTATMYHSSENGLGSFG